MRRLLIDTNALIRFLKGDEPFAERIVSADVVIVHPVVYAEFMNGLNMKTKRGQDARKALEAFLDAPAVELAAVTAATSVYYTKVYRHLKEHGRMIPQNDIWIAASALEQGYELLSHDGHFAQIPMLNVVEV